mmetsp:Transcript_29139/g.75493  ORF Transcript_29139/g.75493 Transcript_29139/m.75493 type:complete len:97 (+) Transcript_29139:182-472(+)
MAAARGGRLSTCESCQLPWWGGCGRNHLERIDLDNCTFSSLLYIFLLVVVRLKCLPCAVLPQRPCSYGMSTPVLSEPGVCTLQLFTPVHVAFGALS